MLLRDVTGAELAKLKAWFMCGFVYLCVCLFLSLSFQWPEVLREILGDFGVMSFSSFCLRFLNTDTLTHRTTEMCAGSLVGEQGKRDPTPSWGTSLQHLLFDVSLWLFCSWEWSWEVCALHLCSVLLASVLNVTTTQSSKMHWWRLGYCRNHQLLKTPAHLRKEKEEKKIILAVLK